MTPESDSDYATVKKAASAAISEQLRAEAAKYRAMAAATTDAGTRSLLAAMADSADAEADGRQPPQALCRSGRHAIPKSGPTTCLVCRIPRQRTAS